MQIPLTITFHGLEAQEPVEDRIRREASRLERFFDRITSCRVVVERSQHRHAEGDLYRVGIDLTVPEREIVVGRAPKPSHLNVGVAIRDSFRAARRQLQDYVRSRRGRVKQHEEPPHGRVRALDPGADHGFIETLDGRDVYFHRHAVEGDRFDELAVGDRVRFTEEEGEEGPQATIVVLLGPSPAL